MPVLTGLAPALSGLYILASSLGTPAPAADMAEACPAMPAPVIDGAFTHAPPVYDLTRSSDQLGAFHVDTQFSRGAHEIFRVGGLTVSEYAPTFNIRFEIRSNPANGHACLYIQKADIDMTLSPTVYIANAFAPHSCRYTDTMRHEQRHVDTAIITLSEYFPALKSIAQRLALQDAVMGPMTDAQIETAQKKIVDDFHAALGQELEVIDKTLFARQQQIDTRAEYMRATRACPNEPLP